MNTAKAIKLMKIFAKFAEVKTDKAVLTIDGEVEVGNAAYTESEDGEIVTAEDGEYVDEDNKRIIVISEGVISEIKEIEDEKKEETVEEVEEVKEVTETEEQLEEEPTAEEVTEEVTEEVDPRDEKIAALEALLAQKDEEIALLNERIAELENKADAPVEEPIELSKQAPAKKLDVQANPALRFFNN